MDSHCGEFCSKGQPGRVGRRVGGTQPAVELPGLDACPPPELCGEAELVAVAALQCLQAGGHVICVLQPALPAF